VVTGRGRARRRRSRASAGPAGVPDELRELAEPIGIADVQVDLILGGAQAEPHRLLRRAAIQIVFKDDPCPGS
jgi:hypothetical protein